MSKLDEKEKLLSFINSVSLIPAKIKFDAHFCKEHIDNAKEPVFNGVKNIVIEDHGDFGFENYNNKNEVNINFGFGSIAVKKDVFEMALMRFLVLKNQKGF